MLLFVFGFANRFSGTTVRFSYASMTQTFGHHKESAVDGGNVLRRRSNSFISDRQKINIFLQCVDALLKRRYVLQGIDEFNFHISIDKETKEIRSRIQEGDIEDFRSFMLEFRKFIAQKEPSNVSAIINTCRNLVKDGNPDIKEALDQAKAVWKNVYGKGVVRIKSGNTNLTPKYVLDLYCSQLFHCDDEQKKTKLSRLLSQSVPAVKIQLLWSLPILIDVIQRISIILRHAMSENVFKFQDT